MAQACTPSDPLPTIPSCTLDESGRRRQAGRFARLSGQVTVTRRGPRRLDVTFQPGFDRTGLEEVLAVERECCPFFAFSFQETGRTLIIQVASSAHEPAIAALAEQLSGGGQVEPDAERDQAEGRLRRPDWPRRP